MNKRILELKRAAWNYAHDHNTVKGELVFGDCINMNFSNAFTEKLAELIVKECAEFCENKNSKLLGTMMKEHFGVEE